MKKEFVLGMEALLIPNAIRQFDNDDNNTIIIPMSTIEELHNYHGYPEEMKNAKKVLEFIIDLGFERLVKEGINQENGSILKVGLDPSPDVKFEDLDLTHLSEYDKRRFRLCKQLQKDAKERNTKVILISMNHITRMKAATAGIKAEEPRFQLFPKLDEQYKGHIFANVSPDVKEQLFCTGFINPDQLRKRNKEELLPNMFLTINDGTESAPALAVYENGKIKLIKEENFNLPSKFHPIKKSQNFLLYALNASPEEVPIVIVKGPAGTGKTYCSLLMGLAQTKGIARRDEHKYSRVLVSAPMLDEKVKKIGAVKGGLEDKLNPYTAGILDNANEILSFDKYLKYGKKSTNGKDDEKNKEENTSGEKEDSLRSIMDDGLFRIISLDLLRGRTFTKSYYIIDEAQNIRPEEMKTLLTRIGEGSKFILLGDPSQTDASGLNEQYNGLTYASEKLKGSPICAQITFDDDETVRSKAVKEILRIFS